MFSSESVLTNLKLLLPQLIIKTKQKKQHVRTVCIPLQHKLTNPITTLITTSIIHNFQHRKLTTKST